MHRPAPLARPLHALKVGPRTFRSGRPKPSLGVKLVAGVVAFLTLMWVVAVYTPIAHPRDIEVDGATGLSAERIRTALQEEASGQSTFNVSRDELMAAVADYPEVAEIRVDAHPPFRLDLAVVMRPPVGRADIGGRSFTVAGDGTVLERANEAAVPKLDPSLGSLLLRDGRLTGDGGALSVLAAAPDTLLELVRTLRRGEAGLEVELTRGPRLIFGSADNVAHKWDAAVAVIAEGSATRATYIDVRVPGRPAVGGLGGSKNAAAADAPPTLTAQTDGTDETVAPAASATASAATAAGTTSAPSAGSGAAAGSATALPANQAATPPAGSGTAPDADTTAPAVEAPATDAPASESAPPGGTGGATTGGITP